MTDVPSSDPVERVNRLLARIAEARFEAAVSSSRYNELYEREQRLKQYRRLLELDRKFSQRYQ